LANSFSNGSSNKRGRARGCLRVLTLCSNWDAGDNHALAGVFDAGGHERSDEGFVHWPRIETRSDDHSVQQMRDVNAVKVGRWSTVEWNLVDGLRDSVDDLDRGGHQR